MQAICRHLLTARCLASESSYTCTEIMEELGDKMTLATRYILSIPELFPMVGLRKDQGGLPGLNENRGMDQGIDRGNGRVKKLRSSQGMNSVHENIVQRGEYTV